MKTSLQKQLYPYTTSLPALCSHQYQLVSTICLTSFLAPPCSVYHLVLLILLSQSLLHRSLPSIPLIITNCPCTHTHTLRSLLLPNPSGCWVLSTCFWHCLLSPPMHTLRRAPLHSSDLKHSMASCFLLHSIQTPRFAFKSVIRCLPHIFLSSVAYNFPITHPLLQVEKNRPSHNTPWSHLLFLPHCC